MKKVCFLALLLAGSVMSAQSCVSFGDKEFVTLSGFVDPVGTINEEGLDFGGELELVSHWGYVKAGTQIFPAVNYFDMVGAGGLNFTTKPFDDARFYTGLRLGLIHRGAFEGNDTEIYPLAGVEAGVDYNFKNSKWFVGLAYIADWREDFLFSGADPKFQSNGRIRVGRKFDLK